MKRSTKFLILLALTKLNFVTDVLAKVQFTHDESYLYITSDDLPNHQTGSFPGPGNPNTISAQNFNLRVSLNPKKNSNYTPIGQNLFGVAINGVVFDPATAEFWNNDRSSGWSIEGVIGGYKTLGIDLSNGHVQPNGTYHYHSIPLGIVAESGESQLVGYAADGFPIYVNDKLRSSYRLKQGLRPSDGPSGSYDGTYTRDYEYVKGHGNLDECNGYFGKTKEYPNGIYYYVVTDEFPMVPRCLFGNGDKSFLKKRPSNNGNDQQGGGSQQGNRGNGQQQEGGQGGGGSQQYENRPSPPPAAIDACNGKSLQSSCSFSGRDNETVSGSCRSEGSGLACAPTNPR